MTEILLAKWAWLVAGMSLLPKWGWAPIYSKKTWRTFRTNIFPFPSNQNPGCYCNLFIFSLRLVFLLFSFLFIIFPNLLGVSDEVFPFKNRCTTYLSNYHFYIQFQTCSNFEATSYVIRMPRCIWHQSYSRPAYFHINTSFYLESSHRHWSVRCYESKRENNKKSF